MGYSVITNIDPRLDKIVKDICNYNDLKDIISNLEKDISKERGKLSERNLAILDFIREC